MKCGVCKEHMGGVLDLELHLVRTKCDPNRRVWERYVEARRNGSSGRRILHEAYPDLWPSDPMSDEVKEKLREIAENRKKSGVKTVRFRRN